MNAEAPAGSPEQVIVKSSPDTYIMEPKLDGIRILAHITEEEVHFYTRTATDKTGFMPYVEMALLDTFPAGTWLDGEVVVFNEDGSQNWGGAQSVLGSNKARAATLSHTVSYVIFDCLAYGGLDVRSLPLIDRRKPIDEHLPEGEWVDQGRLLLTTSAQGEPSLDRYEGFLVMGYEGAMLKLKSGSYRSGKRGHGWTKLKNTDEADVVVMGYEPGKDGFSGMVGAVKFGQYKDGQLESRGQCSGMTLAMRREITAHQQEYLGRVFSIKYMGVMPSGVYRHPQWSKWRDDKPAVDCVA